MKAFTVILILSFITPNIILTAQNTFEVVYDNGKEEYAQSVQQTYDNGYLLFGSTGQYASSEQDLYAVRIDSLADTIWTKTYGGISYELAHGCAVTNDSGFVLFGETNSYGVGGQDYYLIKINDTGDTVWTRTYGGTSDDIARNMTPTLDNGFFLVGYSWGFGPGNASIYAVKVDSAGDTSWTNAYGGTKRDEALACIQTMDTGYIILGSSMSFSAGDKDIYLVKIDSTGNFQWQKTFGDIYSDIGYAIRQTSDTGYLILGSYMSAIDTNRMVLIKTDKNGNLLWQKYPIRGFGDKGFDLKVLSDGNVMITGNTFTPGKNSEMLLTKVNSNGDTLWTKSFGGSSNELGYAIQQTTDNGFVIAGETEGFGFVNFDMYLVKTDSLGNIACSDPLSFIADSSICIDNLMTFTNTTTGSGPFTWAIADSVYNSVDAYYYFDSIGTFKVELATCIDTITQFITVHPISNVNFSFNILNDSTASFSIDSSIFYSSFVWNFADGSSLDSVNPNPVHTFPNVGPYNVNLTITDSNGCVNDTVIQVSFLTGINELAEKTGHPVLHPNPVLSGGKLNIIDSKQLKHELTIFDITGKKIKSFLGISSGESFSLTNFKKGIYLYHIRHKNKIIQRGKLVIL